MTTAGAGLPLPHIRILMATCNGAEFLPAQLQSLAGQSHADWSLWVSDDGSSDATREVLDTFARQNPNREIRIFEGPRQGAAANFLSLLCRDGMGTAWVALCDQDDVWLPFKLARAVATLQSLPEGRPAAYGARTILADPMLKPYGTSPLHRRPTGFHNAMIQNILGGNSTVLNPAAVALLRRAGVPQGVSFHDWWIYLVITAAGGQVVIDPEPVLIYRQHRANVLGTNSGATAWMRRLRQVMGRDYRTWLRGNLAALLQAAPVLSADNVVRLHELDQAARSGNLALARAIWRLGFRRQTRFGTALILMAAALGRV